MTGAELKQRRETLGMSQASLASAFGVRQATIADWEAEKHKIQHPKLLDLALKTLERENQKQHGRRKNREAI